MGNQKNKLARKKRKAPPTIQEEVACHSDDSLEFPSSFSDHLGNAGPNLDQPPLVKALTLTLKGPKKASDPVTSTADEKDTLVAESECKYITLRVGLLM